MNSLQQGVCDFEQNVFNEYQPLFAKLAHGQKPQALIITCSDSRIDPCLITQTKPGDIFVLRNAGNIVPPYGASNGGEAAAIEFAVTGLGVQHIIVCGHTQCGAMGGLLAPQKLTTMPTVAAWLDHAATTKKLIDDHYHDSTDEEKLNAAVEENVLVQLDNIRTHPSVASAIKNDQITLHGWIYEFEHGKIRNYDTNSQQFTPMSAD